MELSGLIFVALAIAWAVYLIPKALSHHEEHKRNRPVEDFSSRLRVLARRDAVSAKSSKLVVNSFGSVRAKVAQVRSEAQAAVDAETGVASSEKVETARPAPSGEIPAHVRRARAKAATKRRQRVLATLLLVAAVVVGCASFNVFTWWYTLIPAGLLITWLVLCRVMVRAERGIASRPQRSAPVKPDPVAGPVVVPAAEQDDETPDGEQKAEAAIDSLEDTASHDPIRAELADPDMWDPVPVPLPTYVGKETARRTVRTIDIDDTGVWSSGRSESDSALAREADEADRARRAESADGERRASGS